MKTTPAEYAGTYQGMALIADPIHRYASFTVPAAEGGEKTEKDLIDSPWLQRLRRIYQLQSARWVYPAAEHTRFQHSLGTMHVAGEFGRHLYPSLKEVCPDVPSPNCVEELLRVAGLLHDVGHGPYGHFFDDHFLGRYGLTHEDLGRLDHYPKAGKGDRGDPAEPVGTLCRGRVARSAGGRLPDQDAGSPRRQEAPLASTSPPALLRHLYRRQPRLCPARRLHDRLFARHRRHRAAALLHLLHEEGPHAPPGRRLGPQPLPECETESLFQRLFPPDDPGARPPPPGDLPGDDGPDPARESRR